MNNYFKTLCGFASCTIKISKHFRVFFTNIFYRLPEAERILTANNNLVGSNKHVETVVSEFGSAASYSLALLGEVCRY